MLTEESLGDKLTLVHYLDPPESKNVSTGEEGRDRRDSLPSGLT